MPETSRVLSGSVIRALVYHRTHVLEVFLALEALLWGAWVIQPFHRALEVIPTAYTVLGIMPEWTIGLAWILVGAVYLYALWRTTAQSEPQGSLYWVGVCRKMALASCGLWSLVLLSFLVAVPGSTATPVYLGLTIASGWVYLRLHLRYA